MSIFNIYFAFLSTPPAAGVISRRKLHASISAVTKCAPQQPNC